MHVQCLYTHLDSKKMGLRSSDHSQVLYIHTNTKS